MAKKKKTAVKKRKTTVKKKSGTKRKSGLTQTMYGLSPELQAVCGAKSLTRPQVVKKLWVYIKKHGLQDAKNRRNINADAKLKAVFGKDTVNMFEMTKLISKHLK